MNSVHSLSGKYYLACLLTSAATESWKRQKRRSRANLTFWSFRLQGNFPSFLVALTPILG